MDAKIRIPQRTQAEIMTASLDQLLTPDHPARGVWAFVETLDLSPWTAKIVSAKGKAGAKANDPRVLAALWLLATLDGVGSARELSRLSGLHTAYRWLCGGKPVNHHTLSDFRNSDPAWLEGLLAESAAALVHAGVASLSAVAQDGVRVRASAGSSSFRREKTLQDHLADARAQVRALKDEDDGTPPTRGSSARERAAREREERLREALANLGELQAANEGRKPSTRKDPAKLRASTTDPDARVMQMADGGFRPAFNVQFATTVEGGVVVGVSVSNEGTDWGRMEPMIEQIETTCGVRPDTCLVDGGFADASAIGRVEESGTRVLAPVREAAKQLAKGKDPYARRPEDTDGSAAWRARMGTPEAKEEYKLRASTAEWVNAQARNHGLRQFFVRGLRKVLSSCLWYALAHNLTRNPGWRMALAA